jgi:hypothetical protein
MREELFGSWLGSQSRDLRVLQAGFVGTLILEDQRHVARPSCARTYANVPIGQAHAVAIGLSG